MNHTIPAVTPPAPTSQPHNCPEGQFVCKAQGECVSGDKVCDFRPDCSDGSDEFGCGKTFREFLSEFPHCFFSSPPHFDFPSLLLQSGNGAVLKVVKLVVGPSWSPL